MEHAHVLDLIGQGIVPIIELGATLGTGLMLVASAVASSVTDNIPPSAMLAKILSGLGTSEDSPLWWSVIFGAKLGGNITPIGSASTLVAVTIFHRYKLPLSFAGFGQKALPYSVLQIVLAIAYVLFFCVELRALNCPRSCVASCSFWLFACTWSKSSHRKVLSINAGIVRHRNCFFKSR